MLPNSILMRAIATSLFINFFVISNSHGSDACEGHESHGVLSMRCESQSDGMECAPEVGQKILRV